MCIYIYIYIYNEIKRNIEVSNNLFPLITDYFNFISNQWSNDETVIIEWKGYKLTLI